MKGIAEEAVMYAATSQLTAEEKAMFDSGVEFALNKVQGQTEPAYTVASVQEAKAAIDEACKKLQAITDIKPEGEYQEMVRRFIKFANINLESGISWLGTSLSELKNNQS